ncbi:UxaA family hydrolase, partial [Paraburkholderia sp. BR14261]
MTLLDSASLSSALILLDRRDDVAIARGQLMPGSALYGDQTVAGMIPPGHKVALRDIEPGEPVRRYGQIIGFASRPIRCGEHVHTQNLSMGDFERDYAFGVDAHDTPAAAQPATFLGIRRADGRVGTRNYIGILTSVNCSATVARAIADHFRRDIHPEALEAFPNVDGVVALT